MTDKSLSTDGHNVKKNFDKRQGDASAARSRSEVEKRAIEEHARKYAGEGNVTNEVTVKEESRQ